MKNNAFKIFAAGVLLTVVLGCSVFNKIREEVAKSQTPQVLTATDGSCQIMVDGDWKVQTDLNKEAIIQAANLRGELYVIVIREGKEDFGEQTNLDAFTELVRESVTTTLVQPMLSEPLPAVINGFPAKQFDIGGEMDKLKLNYLYATIETPENYYQIITWTLASRYAGNKDKLQTVLYSFKEIIERKSVVPQSHSSTK